MKVEMDISGKKIAKYVIVGIVLLAVGYGLGMTTGTGFYTMSGGGVDYLSASDLNRSDIQASILLSRFCEGLGLQSSVYWQQDPEGNVFGQPICLEPANQ